MQVTKGQFIQAMELGGYKQGFGHMLDLGADGYTIVDACALGQACLNLGLGHVPLDSYDPKVITEADSDTLRTVITMNDAERKSVRKIVNFLKKEWKNSMGEVLFTDPHQSRWVNYKNYQGVKVT